MQTYAVDSSKPICDIAIKPHRKWNSSSESIEDMVYVF